MGVSERWYMKDRHRDLETPADRSTKSTGSGPRRSNPSSSKFLWICIFVIVGIFVYLFARAYRVSSNIEAEMRRQSEQTDALSKKHETTAEKLARIEPLDVNSATLEELDLLPQVSPQIAESIIENRPYNTLDDLTRAYGIGDKRLALIRKHLTLTTPEDDNEQKPETEPDDE